MTSSEILRMVFTVLLCIPLLVFGIYLTRRLKDDITEGNEKQ